MHLDREACYRALLTRDARFDGRFFIAVKTTGIYCRPICPARTPRLENVVFYQSAAAAQEAGFRPCLRCRPETTPELGAWHGSSCTVSRALALIADGALNDADVDQLASRLGVGERQLRRLFQKHLGASPMAVAQTRRVFFAKRLITDTGLSMVEVALAAGFGSVRRFNDTFRSLYGRPPRQLRRTSAAAGKAAAGSAVMLTLPFKPPYDWSAMIGFLGARAIPGVELVEANCYRRTISINGIHGVIQVRPATKAEPANSLVATIQFPAVAALPAIVSRIRRVFDLGADPALIGAHLSEDPLLAPLVAERPGLRVPGAWDGFEIAVRAILGQQITVAAATKLAGKLVAAHGEVLPVAAGADASAAGLRYVFPSPDRLAGADLTATLRMPRARVAAISALASAAKADPRLFDPTQGLEHAVARLTALLGIGEWTAQYIAMRCLREPDAFPTADIGLLRAVATAEAGRPTPPQLLARAASWRPWRAYAALHLWAADAAILSAPKRDKPREASSRSRTVTDRDDSARL
ncbi:MAG: helix-turn-helix domain-containing protein [Proteobacteria bacterium]|nr:helix-turn-helix domain-containing protein [Pseudomonadota bacterium]